MAERLPVDDPDFWRGRLRKALAERKPYRAVYQVDPAAWNEIQRASRECLAGLLRAGESVLDCDCGVGELFACLPAGVRYTGVDSSPDLVKVAQRRYPGVTFLVADLNRLPFADGSFDWAVCRSIDGMVRENLGDEAWEAMRREIRRVARRVAVANYGAPRDWKVEEGL